MFIKKRKITKSSIDELAKRYPQDVISDEDAKYIIGSGTYINESGNYVFQVGSSNNVFVITDHNQFNTIAYGDSSDGNSGNINGGGRPSLTDSDFTGCSKPLSSCSDQEYLRAVYGIAGFPSHGIGLWSENNAFMTYNAGNRMVFVNRSSQFSNNYNELAVAFRHESVHDGQVGSTGIFDLEDRGGFEMDAHLQSTKSPFYAGTSMAFKQACAQEYLRYYKQIIDGQIPEPIIQSIIRAFQVDQLYV